MLDPLRHALAIAVLLGPSVPCPASAADVGPVAVAAPAPQDDTVKPATMRADLRIASATLYRGRAAVTRAGKVGLRQGVYELRVGPLPESADLDSVQARVGAGGRLLEVKTETVALPAPSSDNPRVREALARLEDSRAMLADILRQMANNDASLKTIDGIAAKVASDASQSLGTTLDPAKLEAQLAFVAAQRDRLTARGLELVKARTDGEGLVRMRERELADAGGAPPSERFALVTMVAPNDADVPVEVTYLVGGASWRPSYTVRGNPDAGALMLEFDAVVQQATGEDWNDVALVLSTAQPTRAANPPAVSPEYIDIVEPMPVGTTGAPAPAVAAGKSMAYDLADAAPGMPGGAGGEGARAMRFAGLAADASVGGIGPAVEYRIPRAFTAASDAAAERRTRVANIDAKPSFMLVAQPVVDADTYLRARFRNESAFLLLPGEARMYLGADSIGRTTIAETPVGGEVELWFGKEPRVAVRRELVSRKQGESGVFSKSKEIDREYRIVLVNTLTRAVDVEVWDRVPVSRSDAAKVEIKDLSPALATDEKYLKDSRPQGLLKWVVALPARVDGADAKSVSIAWKTRVTWPENRFIHGDAD